MGTNIFPYITRLRVWGLVPRSIACLFQPPTPALMQETARTVKHKTMEKVNLANQKLGGWTNPFEITVRLDDFPHFRGESKK